MDLREQLAAIEHDRWAGWQQYLHSLCERVTEPIHGTEGELVPAGSLIIPPGSVAHWERQINTRYEGLSEAERASDLEQVNRYWPLVEPMSRVQLLRDLVSLSLGPYPGCGGAQVCDFCGWVHYPDSTVHHTRGCPIAVVEEFLGKEG